MKNIFLDLNSLKNESDMHRYFAEKFNFPSHYGNNLDALWDFLTDINTNTTVIFQNHCSLTKKWQKNIVEIFGNLEKENEFISVVLA